MKTARTLSRACIAAVAAGALTVAATGTASAVETERSHSQTVAAVPVNSLNPHLDRSGSVALSTSEEEQLAKDLEILFTRYIPQVNGKYTVNESAVVADGYESQLDDFRTVAAAFNNTQRGVDSNSFNGNFSDRGMVIQKSSGDYAKCVVLGALGIPATVFTYATWTTITTAISAWNWGLAASTIARALGPAFIGGFGKAIGGPALIASALAVAAVSCAL